MPLGFQDLLDSWRVPDTSLDYMNAHEMPCFMHEGALVCALTSVGLQTDFLLVVYECAHKMP